MYLYNQQNNGFCGLHAEYNNRDLQCICSEGWTQTESDGPCDKPIGQFKLSVLQKIIETYIHACVLVVKKPQ